MSASTESTLTKGGGQPIRILPFPDWPVASTEAQRAVQEVLVSGHWWQSGGGRAEEFESWLSRHFDVPAAIAVANGTVALEVALRAAGIGPGDEVLVPGLTFISTVSAVTFCGATPVPVDVRPDTLTIDADRLEASITTRTRAVIAVHLAGHPADLTAIGAVAEERELVLIEDCAQVISAEWEHRRVGNTGALATLSFQSAKLLSAGEGGAVLVRDQGDIAERIRRLSNCGRDRGSRTYDHRIVGTNARMTEFQAALLLVQKDDLEGLWVRRQDAAAALTEGLATVNGLSPVVRDTRATRVDWYMYLIRLDGFLAERSTSAEIAQELTAEGIPASPMYPAIHDTVAYRDLFARRVDPCTESAAASGSVLWLHHRLLLDGERGVRDIVTACRKVAGAHLDE